jgi:hypothetical protein
MELLLILIWQTLLVTSDSDIWSPKQNGVLFGIYHEDGHPAIIERVKRDATVE